MEQSFLVDKSFESMRLDQFLVERMLVFSRERIQALIAGGHVLVNDKKVKSSLRLQWKDRVVVEEAKDVPFKEEKPQERIEVAEQPKILEETSQYFIVEKPAGWLMHDAPGTRAPLISDWILEKDPMLSMVGDQPSLRPGIVHRLDREVSGLIVIARTQSFFEHVKQQFIIKDVHKTYQALVFGGPTKDEDSIKFRIARSARKARMAAIPEQNPDGKTATTHFEVLERFQHTTLLKLWVETGRTNQIRVHCAAYGLPIVGDTLYGKRRPANEKLGRVMLHADTLSFFAMDGQKVSYVSPLPKVFEELLEKGRRTLTGA